MRNRADTWRWRNVPVPEAHVAGLVVGASLHAFVPRQVTTNPQFLWIAGWPLIGAGILLGAWAVGAVGNRDVESPSELVTTGPFAFSRNPLYIAWTALYVGIAFVVNTAWLFILLPVVLVATHITVRREGRSLEKAFGDGYREYKNDVRRYL
ncbi:isoprenylcysteine carboxylmethyltransferase family protein [Natrinema sp. 1APR25-10V2]|nr:isoprenylcysteine carboxylmethyltransferase family protein [Natrinema sp. 1APR25-10V2]